MEIEKEECLVFVRNIAYLRKKNGLSKRKMANLLGIGVYSITKIEKGIFPQNLNADVIYNIYKEFGIRPSEQFSQIFPQD